MKLRKSRSFERAGGFTLVEMLVVVLIVGILASAAMPLVTIDHRRRQESDLREALRAIRVAIDAYKQASDRGLIAKGPDASGYPVDLTELTVGVDVIGAIDPATQRPRKLYFLRALPRDPFSDLTLPAEETWTLRSYESPPEEPAPGHDVFDVHSKSDVVALDGTKVRSW